MMCRLPVLVWLVFGLGWGLAKADDADTRSAACRAAMQAYQAAPSSAEAERRVRAACYAGAGRAPVLRPPLQVEGMAAPTVPVVPPVPEIRLPATPSVLTQCDTGGCWDNHGQRYSGSGPVYSGPGGAVCTRNGDRIECR